MARFFAANEQKKGDEIVISGNDFRHLHAVLRMKEGDTVTVTVDGAGVFSCRIESIFTDRAVLRVLSEVKESHEPETRVTLFQGLPKGDKLEQVIEKSIELGAFEIVPVLMKRSVVRPDPKKEEARTARRRKIAEAASKQCLRDVIPEVKPVMDFEEAVRYAQALDVVLVPYEAADNMKETCEILRAIPKGARIGIFIGPEGGFEREEIEAAVQAGFRVISLGKRILRTETAGPALIAVLLFGQ